MAKFDVRKYKWFQYKGREAVFETKVYKFVLEDGDIFGVKIINGYYYVLDASYLTAQFKLKESDGKRIVANSKGYGGKVGRYRVEAGEGGKDRRRLIKGDLVEVRADSSMLQKMWYDRKQKILYVTFPNGAEWSYFDVTAEEVKKLERSKSQGRWFNEYIKKDKNQERIEHRD